jgi:RND family efflux transporter MFP subunit
VKRLLFRLARAAAVGVDVALGLAVAFGLSIAVAPGTVGAGRSASPAAGASAAAEPAKPAAAAPVLTPVVTVARAAEREIVERAIVTGTLVPRDEILVAAEVEGLRIVEVLVEEGDVVKQGQVLARLSRDLLEAQLAQNAASLARSEAAIAQARSTILQAEAANVEAQQGLERARALQRSGNTTEAVIEQRVALARGAEGRLAASRDGLRIAEADRAAQEAMRREIEVRLGRTEIRAPVAGIVSRRTARIGATASSAGDPLFRIIKDGEIELEGEVPETQVTRLAKGAPARIVVDATRTLDGRVRRVDPEVDRATRLGKVRIALPKNEGLRVGAFARGTVEMARRTGVAVPLSAIVYDADGSTVLAVVDGKVEARRVRTGLSAEGFVEIAGGVAAGEPVVARAGSFLREGDAVRPVVADAAPTQETR